MQLWPVISLTTPALRVPARAVSLAATPRSDAGVLDLGRNVRSETAWLARGAFDASALDGMAEALHALPLRSFALVKAFERRNDADSFGSLRPTVAWACEADDCGRVLAPSTTLAQAIALVQAPMSCRVASSGGAHATPRLREWLGELVSRSGRPFLDADAYVTSDRHGSASLGWHVDDVDVLLVMLHGSKRFRVAGRAVGSPVEIDAELAAGDAVYIPALTFHTGGASQLHAPAAAAAGGSTLLSVAMPATERGATEAVGQWRAARRVLLERMLASTPESNSWGWASTEAGARALHRTLAANAALKRFLPPEPALK